MRIETRSRGCRVGHPCHPATQPGCADQPPENRDPAKRFSRSATISFIRHTALVAILGPYQYSGLGAAKPALNDMISVQRTAIHMRRTVSSLALVIALAGCGSSAGPGKPIEPAVNAGILAVIHARIEAPIANFARVSVPDEALLLGAMIDGHLEFCSTLPVYYAAHDRLRGVCFVDQKGTGRFNQMHINGIKQLFTLATPVPYTLEQGKGLSASDVAECDDVAFAAWMRDPGLRAAARTRCLQDATRNHP